MKIIDLSADFRLADINVYAQWYGQGHKAPALQKEAVYGLTELNRDAVAQARLVANPGCYPTSVQLPLMPLLESGVIDPDSIIIDAKSGITGAGRSAKQSLLFAEADGGIDAYSVGGHRHAPEIEQGLSYAAGKSVVVNFTPHHMPMSRGILSTIYLALAPGRTLEDARRCLASAYAGAAFVKLLPAGQSPSTQMVRGTNLCVMALFPDRLARRIILVSVIDNLVKGAAGQAIQNMNVMYGLPETLGLEQVAFFP